MSQTRASSALDEDLDIRVTIIVDPENGIQFDFSRRELMNQSRIFKFMLCEPFFDISAPTVQITDRDPLQLFIFFHFVAHPLEFRLTESNCVFLAELAEQYDIMWISNAVVNFRQRCCPLKSSQRLRYSTKCVGTALV